MGRLHQVIRRDQIVVCLFKRRGLRYPNRDLKANTVSHTDLTPPIQPVLVAPPVVPAIPLVCDSPHSGTDYPADYRYAIALSELRKSEDTHVDWLWDFTPQVGGTLVRATFPRSYIDVNRHEQDIDVEMLSDVWPGDVAPMARSLALGNGLVSSQTTAHEFIYSRRLTSAEVRHRIENYWRPYRKTLQQVLQTASVSGFRWHLNLHSMPSNAYERLGRTAPGPLADVVLGNLNGHSASATFTEVVARAFRERGYTVAVNDPYSGQDLLREFGKPKHGHESLQIELNRAIYLNEQNRELLPRAFSVRSDIAEVLRDISAFIQTAKPTHHQV